MSLLTIVKSNPRLKKIAHGLIVQTDKATPRVPGYCVAVGNPAMVIKKYNFETAT